MLLVYQHIIARFATATDHVRTLKTVCSANYCLVVDNKTCPTYV